MRIIHIFYELKYSGAEIMYVEAAPIFQDKGCELIAIATAKNIGEFAPFFENVGYEVIHLKIPDLFMRPIQFIRYFIDFYFFLLKEKADVVHIHVHRRYWWYALCSKVAGVRVIRTVHNIFVPSRKVYWIKYWFERWTARNFFGVVFQSIGDSVQRNELKYSNKSIKVYNWHSPSFYPAIEDEKYVIRKRLKIDSDQFVIISVGGCSKIKNHHDIIRSMAVFPKEMNILYIHLGSGKTEQEELNLAKELNVLDRIRFEGNKNNVRDYLISSDVFVMSSDFEGLGNSTIEAMACGIPVIVYSNPGVYDVVQNEQTGFVVSPEFHSISETVTYLSLNNSKAIEIGQNAIRHSKENFSMSKNASKIFDLYKI
jgi:glycosyltransferase involved in cell wall biosynthesis